MTLQPIASSTIEAVDCDETESTLEVIFDSGKTYLYSEVQNNVCSELMESDSKGGYMRDCVIDCYPYQQIEKRWQQVSD
ncbi:KTSC domain-containing protein [Microcoleus sp. Aus8_D2]